MGDVSLNKRVCSLSRAVCHKNDIFRCDVVFFHAICKRLHNTCRNTVRVIVCGLHLRNAHNFVGVIVDGDCFCVGAANIDPPTDTSFAHLWFLLISEGIRQHLFWVGEPPDSFSQSVSK